MTKRIGHLGILVSDIEKVAKKLSSLFGLEEPKIRDDTTRRMKVAVIKFENVDIELLEDYSEDGLFSRACRD
ncbi:MAG: VOC family protein, partial [Thermoplasmatales archaeon]